MKDATLQNTQEVIMRSRHLFCIAGLGLVCCFAFAQDAPQEQRASSGQAADDDTQVYPMTYRLHDLPVWSKEGNFNPSMLIALIESRISPDQWNKSSKLAPYFQDASLVVSTTRTNHRALAELISHLRAISGAQVHKDCGSCGRVTGTESRYR
jgi:hypothetical protein